MASISSTGQFALAHALHSPSDAATIAAAVAAGGSFAQAAVVAALTDSSGGATADGTIGLVTAPTALTDNGGGTADATVEAQSTFAPSVAWNGSSVYPSAADATALTAIALAARNNMKELTTAQAANRLAIVALTDAVKELSTKVAAILTSLKNAGIMASA